MQFTLTESRERTNKVQQRATFIDTKQIIYATTLDVEEESIRQLSSLIKMNNQRENQCRVQVWALPHVANSLYRYERPHHQVNRCLCRK